MIKIDKSAWRKVKISDVFDKIEDNDKVNAQNRFDRFLKVEHMDAECLHIKRWSSQEAGEEINPTFYKIFRAGQVLFPTRNPHLRRTALAHFDGICGEKTLTLEPNKELVEARYIPFLFHSEGFYSHSTSAIIGSTNPHCRWRDIANYEFLLPPKEQQAEFAELLWAMDEVIEKNLEVLEKLEVQKTCTENEVFSHANETIGLVVTKTLSGGTPDTIKAEYYEDGTIEWITTKTLNYDFVKVGECRISESAVQNSAAKVLPRGNILAGTRVGVGKFAINEVDLSFSQDIIGLIIDKDKIDIEYFVYQLNSKLFHSKIKPFVRGTTIKGITKDDLMKLKISCPSNSEQSQVKVILRAVKNSISQVGTKISGSKALQKSLINEVF